MLKVLFCGFKYEYGRVESGLSAIEHDSFFLSLKQMPGVEADFFAVDEVMAKNGRGGMNRLLMRKVENERPDLLFCFLFSEELKQETIGYITKKTATKTFNWFADDHWRFPIFSKYWAPLFTAVSTTDSAAVAKYKAIGVNVIKTQWAANTALCKPTTDTANGRQYGITFVGKNYGRRGKYIASLNSAGLPALGFGGGWPGGRVGFQTMLEIFSNSQINLNFTESYLDWKKEAVKLFIKKSLGKYSFDGRNFFNNLSALEGKKSPQIKGRNFEVPACGGFLLTGDADNLRDYYGDGKEIVVFKGQKDLEEKCAYYLGHPAERVAIAKAGYERTLREHTYKKRFMEIFKSMGLAI